jgi:hypothetical protein
MATKLLLLRWLTAGLFVCFAIAVQGTDFRSWALAIIFGLPILWKGSLQPSRSFPWKTDLLITAISASVLALALLSNPGFARPRLSAALMLAVMAASTVTRLVARQAGGHSYTVRTEPGPS